jgi:cell division protein ZapA (FtsZ GTPase activity inhibitor)
MTLYNCSWHDVMVMPVNVMTDLTNWKIKYEETKQAVISEEIDKQKSEVKAQQQNKMSKAKKLYSQKY